MKKLLLVLFFVSCSPSLGNQVLETTTSTALVELTLCEKVEKEYTSLSNELFVTSFELNDYINNLSDALVEDDRVVFFEDMGDNFDHQNIYKNYPVSYTHLRAHETGRNLVCRLLLEKKKYKI